MGSSNKTVISTFDNTATITKFDKTEDKQLTTTISVIEGDFGTYRIVADRFADQSTLFFVDVEMASTDFLRPFQVINVAKSGDNERRIILAEYTLRVSNEAAHGGLIGLTTP